MIKTLHLRNFLSHKDSLLEFSPGVNVLIGPSDSGKTSLIRALRWIADNRPSGDEFRSHWAGREPTKVSVELDSGEVITRIKGTDNFYELDGQVFRAFGTDVPPPISDALQLSPINIQYQLDAPFLLGDSAGGVARYLNQIVNLEDIDKSLANIASMKRQNDSDIRGKEAFRRTLEDEESLFPDLFAAEGFIEDLERMALVSRQIRYRVGVCRTILKEVSDVTQDLNQIKLPPGVEKRWKKVNDKNEKLQSIYYTQELLSRLLHQRGELKDRLEEISTSLKFHGKVKDLSHKVSAMEHFQDKSQKARMLSTEIKTKKSRFTLVTQTLIQLVQKYHAEMPETCPLCGRSG